MTSSEQEVFSYLHREYSGILDDEQIANHYRRYVQFEQADGAAVYAVGAGLR